MVGLDANGAEGLERSLATASPEAKEMAVAHLATAHALLLANHGQLTSLLVRQSIDSLDSVWPSFEVNLLPGFDREFSAQCVGRFTEAQMFVRHALEALGVADVRPRDGLRVIGRAETVFDGLFDLVALAKGAENLMHNKRFGEVVRATHDAVRLSDPELANRTSPLAAFDLDTGETGAARVLDYVSPAIGSPRFWSKDKALVLVVLPSLFFVALVIAVILGAK